MRKSLRGKFTSRIPFLDSQFVGFNRNDAVVGVLGSTGAGVTRLLSMIAAKGVESSDEKWLLCTTDPDDARQCLNTICETDQHRRRVHVIDPNTEVPLVSSSNFGVADPVTRLCRGKKYAGVVIDNLGSIINTYIERATRDAKAAEVKLKVCEAHLLQQFITEIKSNIARHLGCNVWVGHHLRGAVGGSKPHELLTHRDALGCKSLGNVLDACVVIGNHNPSGQRIVRRTLPKLNGVDNPAYVQFKSPGILVELSDAERLEFADYWRSRPNAEVDDETVDALRAFEAENPDKKPLASKADLGKK